MACIFRRNIGWHFSIFTIAIFTVGISILGIFSFGILAVGILMPLQMGKSDDGLK
jgi:hypothetical protein